MKLPAARDAEQAAVGSMLLSRGAIEVGLDVLGTDDFTDERLGLVFGAIADLYHAGAAVDPVTVTQRLTELEKLERVGGHHAVVRIQATTPASAHMDTYAETVARYAAARRAMVIGQEIRDAGERVDLGAVEALIETGMARVSAPVTMIEPAQRIDAFLVEEERTPRWIVSEVLEQGDRLILTGEEGYGKSVWLRQLAWQISGGWHPFLGQPEPRRRVLHVDCENSRAQVARGYALLQQVREFPEQPLYVTCRPQGLDLTTKRDAAWLMALVGHHQAEVLVIGPLYKLHRPPEGTRGLGMEEVAAGTSRALGAIRAAYGCAILIEAHAPLGEARSHEDFRPFGSSLWLRWPEFGLGIKRGAPSPTQQRVMTVVQWRGHRDDTRMWPAALTRGTRGTWPWRPEGIEG